MLRKATNLTVAERFQPCVVGEAVTGKSYRHLLLLCINKTISILWIPAGSAKADIEGRPSRVKTGRTQGEQNESVFGWIATERHCGKVG
jgi:hypothetical protein